MARNAKVSMQEASAERADVGMNTPAQKFTLLAEARVRARLGRGYGRIGPRKAVRRQTGLSSTATHNRCTGETVPTLGEMEKIAAAADPRLNAFFPVAEVAAEIVTARFQLETAQLVDSLTHRLHEEQKSDGEEDVTQGDVRAALAVLAVKGRAATVADRSKAHGVLVAHRDSLLRHLPAVLAVLGDLEALISRVETAH